jgi:hypothetical protein
MIDGLSPLSGFGQIAPSYDPRAPGVNEQPKGTKLFWAIIFTESPRKSSRTTMAAIGRDRSSVRMLLLSLQTPTDLIKSFS